MGLVQDPMDLMKERLALGAIHLADLALEHSLSTAHLLEVGARSGVLF
jgi:hypothetical protein